MTSLCALRPIAFIRNDFKEKFGIPRQSGRAPSLLSKIVFLPEYRNPDALREIESFSHLWLIFDFSECHREEFSPTVRPPRLGGNRRIGVFASRSPFRPNSLGLSSVKLVRVEKTEREGLVLVVSGADLMDGTPIYDIKPYLPFTDCHPDAVGGYAEDVFHYVLRVEFSKTAGQALTEDEKKILAECLSEDPRPSYQEDPERIYKMHFGKFNVQFTVKDGCATVHSVENQKNSEKI